MRNLKRKNRIKDSNNKHNPNQNICALAVARALGVNDNVRYLHVMEDLVRAARTKYTVRSRKSLLKADTVGALRKEIQEKIDALAFIVRVDGHVILLDCNGNTVVDTDPRKRDKRKVTHVYAVWKPLDYDLRIDKNKAFSIKKVVFNG